MIKQKFQTPNIDRLAREGMRFTDAHSPCTVCTPTRYGLMTGQMPFRVKNGGTVFTGVGGPSLIARDRLTLPKLLSDQGYATACVGKWHVGLTFFDREGKPVTGNGIEAVRQVDFNRRIEGGPVDHGFHKFFGTACCPTTDWLYAFIEHDRVPVPPTAVLDRTKLPKHPYANDCRVGLIAPNFDMEKRGSCVLGKEPRVSPAACQTVARQTVLSVPFNSSGSLALVCREAVSRQITSRTAR